MGSKSRVRAAVHGSKGEESKTEARNSRNRLLVTALRQRHCSDLSQPFHTAPSLHRPPQ